jgi:hypothetical protein
MERESSLPARRDVVAALGAMGAAMGGAAAFGLPGLALAQDDQSGRAHDWDWLVGSWDVWHRRLRDRLVGSTEWDEFNGKSALWLTLAGLGTIDDNSLDLPGGTYRGLSIRAFDPAAGKWSIWWLDSRYPTAIDAPVRGGFSGDSGTFIGEDMFKGRPVTARFRWFETRSRRPHWEQALSTDGGKSWEVNWVNYFTRTATTPTPLPPSGVAPHDWDFLVGRWDVRHRKLKRRLAGSNDWDAFGGTLVNWPVLGGQGNVGDNMMDFPAGRYRGVGIRAFDPATRLWSSWWLDGRNPGAIAPPVRGSFADGIGTFIGDDVQDGRPVKARVLWSRITPQSARWEQALSADDGKTWETNWVSDFTRRT